MEDTARISSASSPIFTPGFIEGFTGRSRHAGINTKTGRPAAARWHRSTGEQIVQVDGQVLKRDLREDFLGFSYGFRPDAVRMMHWTRSRSGSATRGATGYWDADIAGSWTRLHNAPWLRGEIE